MSNPNYYNQIIQIIKRLKKAHPFYNMGRHISTAVDASDLWGVSDKELLRLLKKYETELGIDINHTDEEEIAAIIKDGMNLERTLFEEEED